MNISLEAPPPPADVAAADGGGGGDWVTLARAGDDIEAHLVIGLLHEAAIESRTLKERGAPGAWLYCGSDPWAPVTVFVRRHQLTDARLVLAEAAFAAPPAPATPKPASARWRLSLLWWATALSLGILLSALALLQASRGESFCQLMGTCSRSSSTVDAPAER